MSDCVVKITGRSAARAGPPARPAVSATEAARLPRGSRQAPTYRRRRSGCRRRRCDGRNGIRPQRRRFAAGGFLGGINLCRFLDGFFGRFLHCFGLALAGRLGGLRLVALALAAIDLVGFSLGNVLGGLVGSFLGSFLGGFLDQLLWQFPWTHPPSPARPWPPRQSWAPRRRACRACRVFAWRPTCSSVAASVACPGRANRLASRPGGWRWPPFGVRCQRLLRRCRWMLPAAKAIELIWLSLGFGLRLASFACCFC